MTDYEAEITLTPDGAVVAFEKHGKAELFADVAHRAATELTERAELKLVRGIVQDMRSLLELAEGVNV